MPDHQDASPPDGARPSGRDDADLAKFGYRHDLRRVVGDFGAFCVSFGLISILTGLFTAFGLGYAFSGATIIWVWIAVFVAQLTVALVFCELASEFPLAGSAYQWAKLVGGKSLGWAAGFAYLAALLVLQPSLTSAIQAVVTSISSSFELVGSKVPGIFDPAYAKNALILGIVLWTVTTLINAAGVKTLTRLTNGVVLLEFAGLLFLAIVLISHAKRGPGVVFNTLGVQKGHSWGLVGALLVGAFLPLFTFFGFDNATSLAEETKDPRRTGPRALLRSYFASGGVGAVIIFLALLAIPVLTDPTVSGGGLPYIVSSISNSTIGKLLLVDVTLAIVGAAAAGQALWVRLIYAMARDNQLPFARHLARVSKRTQTPIVPTVVTGIAPVLVLLIGLVNTRLFQALISVGLVFIYIAYLCVTGPALARRLKSRSAGGVASDGVFKLGRWGTPLNVFAVVWGAVMTVNLAWPRAEFYGPAWYQQYIAVIVVPLVLAAGAAYYWFFARGRAHILTEHQASVSSGRGGAQPEVSTSAAPAGTLGDRTGAREI
jgi:urea carboxylase system permease